MKKIICVVLSIAMLFLTTACSENKRINGKLYETYGLLNKEEVRKENIEYKLVLGNLVWSVLFFETVIAPFYFIGFDLYEPVGPR